MALAAMIWFRSYAAWKTTALHSVQAIKIRTGLKGELQLSNSVLNIALDLDQQRSADKKGSDRVAVEILVVPSHCMRRAASTRTYWDI